MTLTADIGITRSGFSLDIAFEVAPGTTTALLGPNGAGKSTILEAIAGIVPLDRGHIAIGDRILDDPSSDRFVAPQDRRIGIVFQDYLLFPHLTVRENVGFGLVDRGIDTMVKQSRSMEWLERLGIADIAGKRPSEISGGEAQRTALARALIGEPEILLLDEALAALDTSARVSMRQILADHLAVHAGPRVIVTHDPTEAFLLADSIAVVEAGRISQIGTATEIRLRPRTRYIADLAGSNLVIGNATEGRVMIGSHELSVADSAATGRVLATINPRAISLHLHRPEGSPRNTWQTTVTRLDHFGDRVRIETGDPLPLVAEITPGAVEALGIGPNSAVWLSIKATEIAIEPG